MILKNDKVELIMLGNYVASNYVHFKGEVEDMKEYHGMSFLEG